MKCPIIKDECWGEECVRWDKEHGKCGQMVEHEAQLETRETNRKILDEMIASTQQYTQALGYYQLLWKVSLAQVMKDPSVPEEVKESLQSAQDAQTVERILKNAGLL